LILKLRGFYTNTPEYKKVYQKSSFDNWQVAINTLESWNVLLPNVVVLYRELAEIRNQKAIHFNPETDENDREPSLKTIHLLSEIIQTQFGAFGPNLGLFTIYLVKHSFAKTLRQYRL
jgi:hypothetical protein